MQKQKVTFVAFVLNQYKMENQNNSNQDCGCSDGCCIPQKKGSLWKKMGFFIIVIAAVTIITVKLVAKQNEQPLAKCCNTEANSSCCHQTVKQDTKCCDTPASSSSCSQPAPAKK